MEDQPNPEPRYVPFYLPVIFNGSPAFLEIPVPETNGRFDVKIKCHDDSLPATFEPQEGHWVKKGEYYDLIGAKDAINSDKVTSLALMKDGVRLNPYGDEKISYGVGSNRFKQKHPFDHLTISRN
jgi:hypothetical protein